MTKYPDLICASPFYLGLFGMMYFLGFMIGNTFIPTLGDIYGRKKLFFINYFVYFMTAFGIVVMPGG